MGFRSRDPKIAFRNWLSNYPDEGKRVRGHEVSDAVRSVYAIHGQDTDRPQMWCEVSAGDELSRANATLKVAIGRYQYVDAHHAILSI